MARIQLYTDHNTTSGNHESMGRFELNSPQFPGGESQMSFNVYKGRLSGSEACLAELHNSASSNGFFKYYYNGSKMVPWYSKRIRMLTAFLILFIALCLVMTGLFVWRVLYYDTKDDGVSEVTPGITEVKCSLTHMIFILFFVLMRLRLGSVSSCALPFFYWVDLLFFLKRIKISSN